MIDIDEFHRALKPLTDRVRLIISRAVLRLVQDLSGVQLVQVEALKGEVIDQAEHLQAYGYASHPLPGAEAVVAAVGGARNHPLILVIADRRYRPGLEAGETIIHDDQGQTIHVRRDGVVVTTDKLFRVEAATIELHASERVRIEADAVEIHATDHVRIDAGGAGVTYWPDKTDDWRQGLPTVNHPPSPPEHG